MYRTVRPFIVAALCIVSIECSSDHPAALLPPPTLTSIGTTAGVRGTTVNLALAGTNFVPQGTTVAVSGDGVTVMNVTVSDATSASASLDIAAGAALGSRDVTVATASGTSTAVPFVVNPPPPTIATVLPSAGVRGTTRSVSITGTDFVTGATTVVVSGGGVTVRNVTVGSATQLTADVTIDTTAAIGDRELTVSTAGGASGSVAFSIEPQPPTISSLSPATGVTNTVVEETLKGTNFVPGATVLVSGGGVTVTDVAVVDDSTITARFTLAGDATLGARTVTVMTTGGTSSGATFTVNPPAAATASITPSSGPRGSAVSVSITGSNFVSGATSVAVAGTGVVVSNVVVTSSTLLTATFTIDTAAALGAHDVSVITAGGSTGGLSFTVNAPPTLTNASPATGLRGEEDRFTLTGTNFVPGGTAVHVSGDGVTVKTVNVTSSTSLTALLVIAADADVGAHYLTVTTAAGTSRGVSIDVVPLSPTLASVSPNTGAQTGSQTVTLTGTNFLSGATTVNVSGTNVTVSSVNVASATSLTATSAVSAGAATGARTVTVKTAGGTSTSQNFTVITAPTITTFTAGATHVTSAQPSLLTWTTSNAASCSIDNGVGSVACASANTSVTPGTTKTYTLSATSAGATATATSTIFANEPGKFVYTAARDDNAIHMYTMDTGTGDLTPLATATIAAGTAPYGVTVDPSGRYAYAANRNSDNVSMYTIDRTTGELSSNGTVAAGNESRDVLVDPTGRFAYVVNQNSSGTGSVSAYTINASGQLVANGSTIAAGSQPTNATMDGTGHFLYVVDQADNEVLMYSINSDGTLTSLGTHSNLPNGVGGAAADPTGKYLYVATRTTGKISQFSINADGTLTSIGTPIAGGGTMGFLVVDPTGRYVYALDINFYVVYAYKIQSDGTLTSNGSVSPPSFVAKIAIDRQGKFLYVTNASAGITIYSIGSDGTLTLIHSVAAGTNPYGIVGTP
jgi:6-phosphogluconolactonase (cycloisomerase 2 family)